MTIEKLEAVVFDWDGVVADSAQLQVEAEQKTAKDMAKDLGLEFELDDFDWTEFAGWARVKIAQQIFDASEETAEEYRERVVDKTVDIVGHHNLRLIPHVTTFMDLMQEHRLPIGVATSSHRRIYDVSAELLGVRGLIDYSVCHREAENDKPQPGQYLKVMEEFGVEPQRTLVVEDSSSGIKAGKAAGALVMAIATTKSVEYLEEETEADIVTDNFDDAEHWIHSYLPNS